MVLVAVPVIEMNKSWTDVDTADRADSDTHYVYGETGRVRTAVTYPWLLLVTVD